MLYCSYPFEVASVLFEIFLKDSDTYTEISGDIQCEHGLAGQCWKFLTEELSKKRPQLLITLLNAVIDMIEAREANKHETGNYEPFIRLLTINASYHKKYEDQEIV